MTAHDPTGLPAGEAWNEHLVDEPADEIGMGETEDFDAYWAEQAAARKPRMARICGVVVPVPTSMPLYVEQMVAEMQHSTRLSDLAEVITALFGEGIYEQWVDAGIDSAQLRVVLSWGAANANGRAMSFPEAAEMIAQAEAEQAQGKAQAPTNRAHRRASSRTRGYGAAGR